MFSGRSPRYTISFGGPPTPAVRWIIIATVAVYVVELLGGAPYIFPYLALFPSLVLHGWVWQLVTYMLVHALSPSHILFNMLGLWMLGSPVEANWGSKRFLYYYLMTGVGAGVCVVLASLLFNTGDLRSFTFGASGAVFGVLMAFGLLFPDQTIYAFLIFPMRGLHFAILMIAIEFAVLIGATGSGTSSLAHLGGALVGFVYIKFSWRISNWWKSSFGPRAHLRPVPDPRRKAATVSRESVAVPSPARPVEAPARARVSPEETFIQKRADEILDKIAREGMGSLTREEKAILHRHSQILKQRESGVVNLDDYRA